ncbi:MAG: hypothetical protein B6U69_01670 [Thermofilum sp. ex4484_15]|nr:MAG: hypothetical protein B6U69_01670 [Thermofilum sp. ex4484_15]
MGEVELRLATRLLHPKLTVLISAGRGKGNVMTAAWITPVSAMPPLLAVAVSPRRYTYELIVDQKEFAVNVPTLDMLGVVDYCGSVSGREVDKVTELGLITSEAREVNVPLIGGCVSYLECRLRDRFEVGDHVLMIGEVVRAYVKDEFFKEVYDITKFKPVIHLGSDYYCTTSPKVITI